MGQAKQRKQAAAAQSAVIANTDFARVASAIRRLSVAASGSLGVDCVMHAALAQKVLTHLGVESTIEAGESMWRVGHGDGDAIGHLERYAASTAPGEWPFHAWLNVGGKIFDVTTYQLPLKARLQSLADGQPTTVEWAPDFLLIEKTECSTLHEVRQTIPGKFYYRRIPAIEQRVFRGLATDEEDVQNALLLYANPDAVAVGPSMLLGEPPGF